MPILSIKELSIMVFCESDSIFDLFKSCVDLAKSEIPVIRRKFSQDLVLELSGKRIIYVCCDQHVNRLSKLLESTSDLSPPILVLSDSEERLGRRSEVFTMDAIPIQMLSPGLANLVLESLTRDYRKNIRLRKLAHFDALTGSANRHLFFDRFNQAIRQSKRSKTPLSLLFFDLDHFKQINDNYGHKTGDDYLKSFCKTVSKSLRSTDTLGRLGGDEFAVILPDTLLSDADNIAQKILLRLNSPVKFSNTSLPIKASIGAAGHKAPPVEKNYTHKSLMETGDKAAYEAKSKGRNQVYAIPID